MGFLRGSSEEVKRYAVERRRATKAKEEGLSLKRRAVINAVQPKGGGGFAVDDIGRYL